MTLAARRTKAGPRPRAAGSRLQSGLANFISQPKSQEAVVDGSNAGVDHVIMANLANATLRKSPKRPECIQQRQPRSAFREPPCRLPPTPHIIIMSRKYKAAITINTPIERRA